jgi:hypothetical protein
VTRGTFWEYSGGGEKEIVNRFMEKEEKEEEERKDI